MINLKVTIGSSVLTQSIKASSAIIQKKVTETTTVSPIKVSEVENPSNVIVTSLMLPSLSSSITSQSNPVLSFNVTSLPKDFMTSTVLTKLSDDESPVKVECSEYADETENNDETPMEIDEGW